MPTDLIINTVAIITSAYILYRTLSLLAKIRHEVSRSRILDRGHPSFGDGTSEGISVICQLDSNEGRLRNLLTVESAEYEVIAIGDSLRDPESLQQSIERFRMTMVDSGASVTLSSSPIRHIYRSAHRCYRRLVLLDIASSGHFDPTDTALTIATFDHILPLPDGVTLRPKAIERLFAELSFYPSNASPVISCAFDSRIGLYPRTYWEHNNPSGRSKKGSHNTRIILYEQLTNGSRSASPSAYITTLCISAVTAISAALYTSRFAPSAMGITLFTTTALIVLATVLRILLSACNAESVKHVKFYLFFAKI